MVVHYNNMKEKDGIICDLCGAAHLKSFTYYPVKLIRVVVSEHVAKEDHHIQEVDKQYMDLDFCEKCFEEMKKKLLKVIQDRERKSRSSSTTKKGAVWTAGPKGHHKQSMRP